MLETICLYEHLVLNKIRQDKDFMPHLDFVMEKDGVIIGQNVFVNAVIKADDGRDIPIMAMGPICIAPEFKRMGYGKALLDYSLERARIPRSFFARNLRRAILTQLQVNIKLRQYILLTMKR